MKERIVYGIILVISIFTAVVLSGCGGCMSCFCGSCVTDDSEDMTFCESCGNCAGTFAACNANCGNYEIDKLYDEFYDGYFQGFYENWDVIN